MGATSIYNLPYQEVDDPPNGPTLGQDLAEAVEAALTDAVTDAVAGVAWGVIGGNRYKGTGNFASGVTTTEALINMNTGAVVLAANRRYHIKVKMKILWNNASMAGIFHVRDTGLSGTARGEAVYDAANTGSGHTYEWYADYETSSAETKTFVVSGGSSTNTFTAQGGGITNAMWVLVEDVGPAGKVTAQTTP